MDSARTNEVAGGKRRWGTDQRLEFIELQAFWSGSLNRADIREQFGVSAPQASADIATYMDIAPGNLAYDGNLKRYRSTEAFRPRLVMPSADAYLLQLGDPSQPPARGGGVWIPARPSVAVMPVPNRAVDAEVLRALLAAMRAGGSVEVFYQSMSLTRPLPQWRGLTPHSLATDGLRWHLRAYCHEAKTYKDFLLSRIREVRAIGASEVLGDRDVDWNTMVEVDLIPNPELSPDQQAAVDWDYQMGGEGVLHLRVRRAMLYYLRQRLRLDIPKDRSAERPVVLANPEAFNAEISRATGSVDDR